jgi:hypothetical protein
MKGDVRVNEYMCDVGIGHGAIQNYRVFREYEETVRAMNLHSEVVGVHAEPNA